MAVTNTKGKAEYPKDHKPGMPVPKGGSSCSNCEYLKDVDKRVCGEPNFVKWNGSEIIPGLVDEYCSDWYEPAPGTIKEGRDVRDVKFEDVGM